MRKIKYEIETILEGYEWLVVFEEENSEKEIKYIVSINYENINWDKLYTDYIHIENIDYIYYVYEGDERGIEKCYCLFEEIEKEVISALKEEVCN